MATSAIGPGFLTQTTVFTQQLLASFGFVILISVLLDIGAQMNIWRVLAVTEKHAQDIANELLPGLGYFVAALIVVGGLAFNVGNMAGCGLGLNVLTGMDTVYGSIISCIMALFLFWMKEAGKAMDLFAKVLGVLIFLLTLYVAFSSHPPVGDAVYRTFVPEKISAVAIVTLVGGTVGGYICFAGGHRLLDAGIKGQEALPEVTRSSVTGILVTATMRVVLFLAALGVVMQAGVLDTANPPASVFRLAAGELGYRFFGVVMWAASITSVVGASYTSVSFLRTFHPWINRNDRWLISCIIVFSTIVFAWVGQPVKILVTVAALNGLVLPVTLAVMLLAARNTRLVGTYRHPMILQVAGWIVVVVMSWMSYLTIARWLGW
ncbi:MAG: divalent metal cation transporter [Chitinophagaceae bacterium]|nr:divalent metal cation transporter [Chitinophagaceae bacterium]MEA3426079.1 NRAMP family divalent metal transporter [Bacteroidota bacterium]MCA6452635.1 divalent metal cation transporter [Chitinophagaceae bacterium]MCA6455804.1 divalent metal cation transporter [Chitinophagaceae bacterium]MCA6459105.1 divalent metal cation transporter [Chitinophagaceae bacterium]